MCDDPMVLSGPTDVSYNYATYRRGDLGGFTPLVLPRPAILMCLLTGIFL